MTTIKEYSQYGEELEKALLLKTYPIAVKMLESEKDIPEGAIRPKRDRGYHLAQCQAFAMTRRQGLTIAMLKEDHWCWAPLMGYGLVEDPHDAFVDSHAFFPRFEYGKYIGMVTAPLKTATFEPDMVLIYSDTAQLREMIGVPKYQDKELVKSEFDPIDSCVFSVVPVITEGKYRITLPDPGEASRAFAGDDEIIFSVPKDKLGGLVEGVKRSAEMRKSAEDWAHILLRPDFPRPDFYKDLFRKWGLDVED
ncbi:MAG: DUF169 domain-containing protein [Dehalococcoidales bacterium]|nr:DUF169 domain-containing protein [Dehalococcoidales bacterium]